MSYSFYLNAWVRYVRTDKELEGMKREPVLDVYKTGSVSINVTFFLRSRNICCR
jgi:hypothetical protein